MININLSLENQKYYHLLNICNSKDTDIQIVLNNLIDNYIKDNFIFKDKFFTLKYVENYLPVTILKKEDEMLYLSDGNILNYSTFNEIYIESESLILSNVVKKEELSDEEFEKLKKTSEKLENKNYESIFTEDEKLKIKNSIQNLKEQSLLNISHIFPFKNMKIYKNYSSLFIFHKNKIDTIRIKKSIQEITNITDITFIQNNLEIKRSKKIDYFIDIVEYMNIKYSTEFDIHQQAPDFYLIDIEPNVLLYPDFSDSLEFFDIYNFKINLIKNENK